MENYSEKTSWAKDILAKLPTGLVLDRTRQSDITWEEMEDDKPNQVSLQIRYPGVKGEVYVCIVF